MKWIAKTVALAAIGTIAGNTLSAVIPEQYQTILDRNAFGLLPPPPPPAEPTNAPPPINLKLTGFATIGGEKRVFFMIPPNPKDPKDTQQYLNLAVGQREGTLEVLSIAEADGEVRITNGGSDMVLSLKKDGVQPPKLAPGVTPAPMPMANPAGQVSPVYNPNAAMGNVAQPPMLPGQMAQNPQTNPNAPQLQPNIAPPVPGQPPLPQQQQQAQQQQDVQQTGGDLRSIPVRSVRTLRTPPIPEAPMPQ